MEQKMIFKGKTSKHKLIFTSCHLNQKGKRRKREKNDIEKGIKMALDIAVAYLVMCGAILIINIVYRCYNWLDRVLT